MTTAQIATLIGAAVLVFWMLGAYNRLVALRNEISQAWKLVGETLQQRHDTALELVARLRLPLASEQGALDTLTSASIAAQLAAKGMSERPVRAANAIALIATDAAWNSSSARVLALASNHAELRFDAELTATRARLQELAGRLDFARQLFNQTIDRYNAAVRQIPTRLLARLYGFGTAGRL